MSDELFDAPLAREELTQNQRVLSVTEFTRRVKDVLSQTIRPLWVKGEISNLRAQASGHVYFVLKDVNAQVSAVLFRGDAMRQNVALRDGMQVVAFGEISVYEARGQYQFIVRAVVEDGVGRLQREFEALKRRLSDEGLFDSDRKKPIPAMPATIGFITSPTGAAVQDFARILARRGWRGRLVILPTKVQGDGAAGDMAAMLHEAEAINIFDLLVIGRGGGSLEDLWAFNEELLVRAVATCSVPIISAVGHEIDFTLCDFAADARAETPSGAAELISSNYINFNERVSHATDALINIADSYVDNLGERLANIQARLRLLTPRSQIEQGQMRTDEMANRFRAAFQHALIVKQQKISMAQASFKVCDPSARVSVQSQQLLALWKRLHAASPASVLNRGFVIIRDEKGLPLERRAEIVSGKVVSAEFADGRADLRAE